MKGFTLVELMIVMAILAVLAILAYPSYADSVRRTKRLEGQMALIDAMENQERYLSEHRSYKVFSAG
ncbi:MAG TPA: prepilin-type N-terminal cleavage/methylation domain-containing protein, partial [Allosphingosinicella sp.]